MMNMEKKLRDCLRQSLKGRVLIVGIGNTFRGDDGAGPALISSLKSKVPSQLFLDVGEVPENFLGNMVEWKADTILFVDAADFGARPGSTKLIDTKHLNGGGFSTHSSSLSLVVDYLKRETQAEILLLGIQPGKLRMGDGLSKPVEKAVQKLEEVVLSA